MARPRKQTVDYFPHSCTHKTTIFILEQRYGNDGYAFWFKLLEMLGQADGHYLDLNKPATWEFLQSKTRLSNGSCGEIIDLLARLEAIDPDLWAQNKVVWCQKFVDGISEVYRNRRVETPARPHFYCKKPSDADQSTPEKPQSKLKETKGNKRRVDHRTSPAKDKPKGKPYGEFRNVLLTDSELTRLQERFGTEADTLIQRLSVYIESSGKRYKSHYATVLNWKQRDDNEARGKVAATRRQGKSEPGPAPPWLTANTEDKGGHDADSEIQG